MTVELVQSAGIQDLDLQQGQMVTAAGMVAGGPVVGLPGFNQGNRRLAGTLGTAGQLRRVQGFVCPTNGATSPSWYPVCRIRSDNLVLSLEAILASGTITTFTGDVTAAWSDSASDGTPYSLQVQGPPSGLSAAPGNALILNPNNTSTGLSGANALFAPAFPFAGLAAKTWTELLFNAGVFGSALGYVAGKGVEQPFQQPLWQAAGFTSDPRGSVDIGILTTATNSLASAVIGLRVTYLANVPG
jgi:hypothetical protein